MKVKLVSYTPDALTLLLRTKGTRLGHKSNPADWTPEERSEHLAYMRDTIKSSWEFVDYTFQIEGVTRAFTHQLVRTRTGSYAQEAMRVVDARDAEVVRPEGIPLIDWDSTELGSVDAAIIWDRATGQMMEAYAAMLDLGVPTQDARGILPTNISTSIFAKFNLRTLHEMAKLRLCTRTQGEYQDVFRAIRAEVAAVHPWAEEFMEVHCVATGTCAFPRYGKVECPVYVHEMDNTLVRETARHRFNSIRYEAAPVAKDGRAM
jgi:flavin-dependent thymidylate synthase